MRATQAWPEIFSEVFCESDIGGSYPRKFYKTQCATPAAGARILFFAEPFSKKSCSRRRQVLSTQQFFAKPKLVCGCEEFRENRKQSRCCNWIQLPKKPIAGKPEVKAGRRQARSQNIRPTSSHSCLRVCGQLDKTSSQKRRMRDQENFPLARRFSRSLNNQETRKLKKQIIALTVALFATITGLHADVSYLLVQGPFGSSGTEKTFEWQVNYPTGYLQTGQDLFTAVFGSPSLDGTYTDAYGTPYNYYTAGNSTQGIGYIDFGSTTSSPPSIPVSPFAVSFTLGSTRVTMDSSYSPGWNYYVAGGGGPNGADYPSPLGVPYPDGSWDYSNDGALSRTLANGSFDAWVFGGTYPAATIDNGTNGGTNDDGSTSTGTNSPTTVNFATAKMLNVPEPGSATLLLSGAGVMMVLLKRRRS
jgi:hypothetical protein